MTAPAVLVEDLHVAYGTTWALDGVDLTAAAGSTLGVLGHNGAGKTTLIRTLTTLVRPMVGRTKVARVRIRVVLPAPLWPSTPSVVPAAAVRSTPSRAHVVP